MSLGVIGGVSGITVHQVQWKIPDFFSIEADEDKCIESPGFSMVGCRWKLRLYPKGQGSKGYVSVFLRKDDPESPVKIATYTVGIKTANGSLEEKDWSTDTFKEGRSSWGWPSFIEMDDLQKRKSELAPSGAITLTCHMEDPSPWEITPEVAAPNFSSKVDPQRTKQLAELKALSSDFKDLLLDSGRKCDVTINVKGKEFRAHRAVLSARSPVFRAMYEHETEEAETGVVNVADCDPDSFGEFLSFIYTAETSALPFRKAYPLYATAEKYGVQRLKPFCTDFLRQNLTEENVCDVVTLADRYCDHELMSAAQNFFNEKFHKILVTSEWDTFSLKDNPHLANELLKVMASAVSKNSQYQ